MDTVRVGSVPRASVVQEVVVGARTPANEAAHGGSAYSGSHRRDSAQGSPCGARTTRWPCCPPHLQLSREKKTINDTINIPVACWWTSVRGFQIFKMIVILLVITIACLGN